MLEAPALDAHPNRVGRTPEALARLLEREPPRPRRNRRTVGELDGELFAERGENRPGEVRADERLEPGRRGHGQRASPISRT